MCGVSIKSPVQTCPVPFGAMLNFGSSGIIGALEESAVPRLAGDK